MQTYTIVALAITSLVCFGIPTVEANLCQAQREKLAEIQAGMNDTDRTRLARQLVDIGRFSRCFIERAADRHIEELYPDFQRLLENFLNDKQAGASAGSEGSTNLVSRGRTAKVISFAVEHGALTQSVEGNVVTLRGNVGGLPSALARKNVFLPYCDTARDPEPTRRCISNSALRALRRASFHVSFDTSRNPGVTGATNDSMALSAHSGTLTGSEAEGGDTEPNETDESQEVVFEANPRQVSSFGFRVELINQRDVSSSSYVDAWEKAFDESAEVKAAAANLLDQWEKFALLFLEPTSTVHEAYRSWTEQVVDELVNSPQENLEAQFTELLDEFMAKVYLLDPELSVITARLQGAYRVYSFAEDELIEALANKPVLSVEYTNTRPVGQDSLSNIRLIYDRSLSKGWIVTANGAVTWYDSEPEAADGRVRDIQAGVQMDYALGTLPPFGTATLSVAGYYQWMQNPAVLTVNPERPLPGITFLVPPGASEIVAEKGNIGIVQAKLILGPKNSGVKIPFAVTYANRTELVLDSRWSANFGVTLDLDSLFMGN